MKLPLQFQFVVDLTARMVDSAGVATLGGQKADRNGTRLGCAVESARFGAAIKGSAKPLYVGSIPTRASSIFPR